MKLQPHPSTTFFFFLENHLVLSVVSISKALQIRFLYTSCYFKIQAEDEGSRNSSIQWYYYY